MNDQFSTFQAKVLADPALQERLDTTVEPRPFSLAASEAAAEFGLQVPAERFLASSRPMPPPPSTRRLVWPDPAWLPTRITGEGDAAVVDWARFGSMPLDHSFFGDAVVEAVSRPFNRVFRWSMTVQDLVGAAPVAFTPPRGLIFHMSRCGSTLVARMLGSVTGVQSLSEPGPLDDMLRIVAAQPSWPAERKSAVLRSIVGALTRRASQRESIVKLDSWHVLALPMFQAAFPEVPWVYLTRDPVDVLVSQSRRPGTQAVPALLPEQLFRRGAAGGASGEGATARVLAAFHRAVLPVAEDEGCLIIDYSALPGAVAQIIAPHFGISLKVDDTKRMRLTAARDAKSPGLAFVEDGTSKQAEATASIRAEAELHLAALHGDLLAKQGGPVGSSG